MASLEQMRERVRGRLGHPSAQAPSNYDILLHLTTQLQRYINRISLSERTWAVDEVSLTVANGVEDYPIAAVNFGRPIQVRTVYPQNPSYVERDIEFDEMGDMNFNWPYPRNLASLITNVDGSPHTAQRMAFFRRAGLDQPYVRVTPIPALSATYSILYQVGDFAHSAALATVPVLPQHHDLIEIRTAISLLPLSRWGDDRSINADTRKELAMSLANDERALAADYEAYIRSIGAKRRPTIRNAAFSID